MAYLFTLGPESLYLYSLYYDNADTIVNWRNNLECIPPSWSTVYTISSFYPKIKLIDHDQRRSWHLPSNLSVGLDCFSPRSKLLLFLYVCTCVHFSFPSPIQKEKLWIFLVSFAWQMFNSIKSIKVGKWLNTAIPWLTWISTTWWYFSVSEGLL